MAAKTLTRAAIGLLGTIAIPAMVVAQETPLTIGMSTTPTTLDPHAGAIKAGEIASVSRLDGSQRDTTHISVIDKDGNAVAMTHTLGSPSGAITDGLGFMYNGTMSRFNPVPGKPGSIAPGKRRPSSAAPTIVFKGDEPSIVIGAPGGSYIAPAVAQCLMNMFNEDAIDLYQRCPIGTAVQVLPHIADQAESTTQVSQTTPVE